MKLLRFLFALAFLSLSNCSPKATEPKIMALEKESLEVTEQSQPLEDSSFFKKRFKFDENLIVPDSTKELLYFVSKRQKWELKICEPGTRNYRFDNRGRCSLLVTYEVRVEDKWFQLAEYKKAIDWAKKTKKSKFYFVTTVSVLDKNGFYNEIWKYVNPTTFNADGGFSLYEVQTDLAVDDIAIKGKKQRVLQLKFEETHEPDAKTYRKRVYSFRLTKNEKWILSMKESWNENVTPKGHSVQFHDDCASEIPGNRFVVYSECIYRLP